MRCGKNRTFAKPNFYRYEKLFGEQKKSNGLG